MKKHKIREYSPAWWLMMTVFITAFVAYMSIPSSIEF
mgnify:CR=1 FL=1